MAARGADPARMLLVLPKWVGDLAMATPAMHALRQHFPDSHIAVLVRGHLADVLTGCTWINEVIHWPPGKGMSRPKRRQGFLGLAADLRERQFDWAVLLTNSFRSALLTRLAGIPRRIGYDRDGRGLLLTDKLLPERFNGRFVPVPMIRYYNAIARYLGCRSCAQLPVLYTSEEDEIAAAQALTAAGVEPGRPIVVVNPAASFGPAKCWLAERFAEVADRCAAEFGAAVFISCGPKEIDVARAVYNRMQQTAFVLDRPVMPLGPSKALIRRASLLITNDTGPRHFANAFGTPVVTVVGPTDPQWSATDAALERLVIGKVHCAPCMKRRCPTDHRCMTKISSEMVMSAARELIGERAAVAARN